MPSSYSKHEVERMVAMYTANPCLEVVAKLSVLLNRPKKSIISKLVKEGVYVKRGYRTKTGELPVTKIEYVRRLEELLDISLVDLDKAPKTTLKVLTETLEELQEILDSID